MTQLFLNKLLTRVLEALSQSQFIIVIPQQGSASKEPKFRAVKQLQREADLNNDTCWETKDVISQHLGLFFKSKVQESNLN